MIREAILLAASLGLPAWADDFAVVEPGRSLEFPLDHGAHPRFRIEWWYFTGRIQAAELGDIGFQLTFFRTRLAPGEWRDNPSAFTPRQIYFAHGAIGLAEGAVFEQARKTGREGLDGAHAARDGLDISLEDWYLRDDGDAWSGAFQVGDTQLRLRLVPRGQPVLHGDDGFSAKDADPRYASYYYSMPRVDVTGSLRRDGRTHPVRGVGWLDHEWSSGIMPPRALGWDWFGLRLADGGSLMAFQMRGDQPGLAYVAGTWIDATGTATQLDAGSLRLRADPRRWRSPTTGIEYPLYWTLIVGGKQMRVSPRFEAQEMLGGRDGPTYWEGAVNVSGDLVGEGFLELTGYSGRPPLAVGR